VKCSHCLRLLPPLVLVLIFHLSPGPVQSQDLAALPSDSLAHQLERLQATITELEKKQAHTNRTMMQELARLRQHSTSPGSESRFIPGGYGEIHWNGTEGSKGEMADIHRFVFYLGYQFNDWILLNSETEIEHAFVAGGNGEVAIEQLAIDFLLSRSVNIRAGRILVPMGIVNPLHEPPIFNGVERPFIDTQIIPSTWFAEGAGIFGLLGSAISYEAYVMNGLDATGFSGASGIRGGRMKERPGYTDPAVTGRVDVRPGNFGWLRSTRIGLAGYSGGGNNGNLGSVPGVDVRANMVATDADVRAYRTELRGQVAYGFIKGAYQLSGDVGSELFGWYGEAAQDILPAGWKRGKLEQAQFKLFCRYEMYNTQLSMPTGQDPDKANERAALTAGITFLPLDKVALKADVQVRSDAAGNDLPMLMNLGIGWMF